MLHRLHLLLLCSLLLLRLHQLPSVLCDVINAVAESMVSAVGMAP
jgi:hypothetical protein